MHVLFLLISVFFFSIMGCHRPVQQASMQQGLYNSARTQKLSQLSHFRVSGKVAFRQGDTGGQAKFIWKQTGKDFTLQLFNPFGGEEAHLAFHHGQYQLSLPNKGIQHSQSIELLFKENLGWSAPIAHLSYWIRGIPLPKLPSKIQYDFDGNRILTQDDWKITYSRVETVNTLPLPSSMLLEQQTKANELIRLKMVLHWSLE
ncbi:MAG: lipoprotein localization protein LolB [Pseudomonadota bacterium]